MPMFKNESDTQSHSSSTGRSAGGASGRPTYVAPGTRLRGEITGSTDLVVDGEFEGKLNVQSDVTVGEQGVVMGQIDARSVRVAGKVQGDIHCRERLELTSSGKVEGDLAAPSITIEDGAFIKGKVEMTRDPKGDTK